MHAFPVLFISVIYLFTFFCGFFNFFRYNFLLLFVFVLIVICNDFYFLLYSMPFQSINDQ